MRGKKKVSEAGVNLGIIITPMLDMSFQVLAFFIMTYHPSALEGHFDIKLLPPSKVATKGPPEKKDDLPPVDEAPELTDVLQVNIKAVPKGQKVGSRNDGDPSSLTLTMKQDATPVTIADIDTDGRKTDVAYEEGLKKLGVELKKYLEDPSNSKANIKIEPDPELRHMYTMAVYDVCKLAGFQNIQFVGPSIDRKKE